ncbi:MAG: T9SS type A sorting domain-containing protein [Bacteroidetes bacterium]|nr:T9SS type A sorting domain-containing protein [Bacteroidota bacterium]
MRKIYTVKALGALIFFLMSFLFFGVQEAKSQIYEPEGLNMPGIDTWDNPPNNLAFASSTQVAGGRIIKITSGTPRWQTIFSVAASGADVTPGNKTWLFTSGSTGNPWANKWAGVTVSTNTLQNYTYNSGADNTVSLTGNKWYTVVWEDSGYSNTRAIFMETSAAPVNILTVSEPSEDVGISEPYIVSITTSANPSAEERFYLRYTTNNWTSSQTVTFTMGGSSGTASIPGQPDGTTVAYYVFSSTVPGISSNFDLYSIRVNNKSGAFYSYQVGESSGPDTFTVTFNLDISPITGFNHTTEKIYISGIPSWIEPGVDPSLALSRVGESDIYTITFELEAGDYSYKFFRNASWDFAEVPGAGTDRQITITESVLVNHIWADFGGGVDDPNYGIRDDDGLNLPTITYWFSGETDDVTERGVDFDSNNLGTIEALYIKGAAIKTWKAAGGDVTGAAFQYKVWKSGDSEPVSFVTRNIGWTSNDNPEETLQTWAGFGDEINVLTGLTEGTYNLKIFFSITGAGTPGTTTDGPYIAIFTITDDGPGPDTYTVTFNLDISPITDFDHATEKIYISGIPSWIEPGVDPSLALSRVGESDIYTITFELEAGDYAYKFFRNESWDFAELPGAGTDRQITITESVIVNHIWADFGGGGDDPNYGIRDDDGLNLPTITYWYSGETDDVIERGFDFDANNLGTIEALYIKGAAIKTWKAAGGDVTGAAFQYKVWKSGDSEPVSYVTRNLGWTSNDNPEETLQTWAGFGDEINILTGLTEGTYNLKIFFSITGAGTPGTTTDGPYIATFTITDDGIGIDTYTVTFNLDISPITGFNHATEKIYISGIPSWIEPGVDPSLALSRVGESDIYTITFELEAGDYAYKFFRNESWDFAELPGAGTDRQITITESVIVNHIWADFGGGDPDEFPVTFTVTNNNPAVTAVNIKGSFNEWTEVLMNNTEANIWSATFDVAPGTYEWGVTNQNSDWLLPPMTNLEFTVDAEGNITGTTTFTIESGGGGDDPNYGIRDDEGLNLPTITYWFTGETDDVIERGVDFDSNNLGAIEALYIKGAAIKTWKAAGGDVTGAAFQYKVWKSGDSEPVSYVTRNLGWTSNDNPEETLQTWAGFGDEINVVNGLIDGIYRLKIMFSISGTGIPGKTTDGPFTASFTFEVTSPEDPEIVFANLQYPGSASINVGGNIDVLAQVIVDNAAIDPTNGVDGLQVWIGYSNTNTNPSTWTNWVAAFYNGINEYTDRPEYQANIGSNITDPGTYYYASRFKLNDESYIYGGYNVMDGGFWNGTTNVSGVLTVIQTTANYPVTFTVTNNNVNVTEVNIKGEFNEWTDILMDNTSGNIWESTFYMPAGTYEWGISDQDFVWLLPPMTNLEFTVDAEGNITGETTYTIPPDVFVEQISTIKPNIYPNPVRNYFVIDMDWNNARIIRIIDVSGKVVIDRIVSNETDLRFEISGFRQGFYFVEINTKDGRIVLPLVVNK